MIHQNIKENISRKYLIWLLMSVALLLTYDARACELSAGPGAAVRLTEGKSGGVFTIGCNFKGKWELRAFYFGEQRIYDEQLRIEPYAGIAASRLWTFREGQRVSPYLGVGVMLKEAQRCHFDGDLDCNRIVPLPFCFLTSAGVRLGDVVLTLNHCSNAGLDHGPEAKNLGQDFLRAEVRF